MEITIGKRKFDQKGPLYFIADVGANHDGDLDRALRLIELAKEAGADAAKFQNFKADKIVSKAGFSNMGGKLSHQANWKKPVFEIYEDASISQDWTPILKQKCDDVGIDYFTSAYDFDSVDHVGPYLDVYKIGSGDITWTDMLEYTAKKGKPVIVATGASSMEDVERAMQALQKNTGQIVLMQCNTNYTGRADNFRYINLNVLKKFGQKYPDVILGLSDHTSGHATVLGAIALGATFIEKHFTDDNSRSGPDHAFAMNAHTWREMVERSNELFLALGTDEKIIEDNEQQTVLVQRRGLRYTKSLPAGRIITEDDLFPLRPYQTDGLHPYEADRVVGKKLINNVDADQYTSLKDF
jgi:N-acetylneuraminate synthase